jgi:hypothetical protein
MPAKKATNKSRKTREDGQVVRRKFLDLVNRLRDRFVAHVEEDPAGAGSWNRFDDEFAALDEFFRFVPQTDEED